MLKGTTVWSFMLIILSFTAASSKFNAKGYNRDSQIVLKSLTEFSQQDHLYRSLRIHAKVIEESFNSDEVNKSLQSALANSAKIMSELLLTKASPEQIKLDYNNQCTDIRFAQMTQSENLEVDIVIFAFNNEENVEIVSSKKCKVSENAVKSMALEINAEKFMKLDELSQIKELCVAISNTLYEDNEWEKQMLLSEIGGNLAKERKVKIAPILGDNCSLRNCQTCDATNTKCLVCNPGYLLRNSYCDPCYGNCATCATTPSNCLTCSDPDHMSAAPGCICPVNGAIDGSNCVCNSGYFYSSNTVCTACLMNCDECIISPDNCLICSDPVHMSASPACACPDNSSLQGSTCYCNTNYFFSNKVCTACNANCVGCNQSSDSCLTCSDWTHMTPAPKCACPINGSLLGTTCICNPGYFFSENTVCSVCNTNCATCTTNAKTCTVCSDPTHMSAAPACTCPIGSSLYESACVCSPGYFFNTNNVCSVCNPNCATCTTSASTCDTCSDATHMLAPECACPINASLQENICVCNTGYFFSTNTVCSACNANCVTCTTSAKTCDTCTDITHMTAAPACDCPINGSLQGNVCVCNSGYFFSSAAVCTACDDNCATCATTADECVTCADTAHMSAAPDCACPANSAIINGSCICDTGYYYSSNTVCSVCKAPCSTCSTSASTCTACEDGYYLNGNSCSPCQVPCSTCSTSASTCISCEDGYYLNGNSCSPCQAPCSTCSSSNYCTTCDDSLNMTLNNGVCICTDNRKTFSTASNTCVCKSGYFTDEEYCSPCTSPCNVCTSATDCQGCMDGYWLNEGVCQACTPPCSKCNASATKCTACVIGATLNEATGTCSCSDPNASFNNNNDACICNPGYVNNAGTCISCTKPCATCSGSTTNCSSCIVGYILNGNTCNACGAGCKVCTSSTVCTQCIDNTSFSILNNGVCGCSDPNQEFNINGFCTCNFGYFLDIDTCIECEQGCKVCTSSTECEICWDATNGVVEMDGSCICKLNGQTYDNTIHLCDCYAHSYPNYNNGNCDECGAGCSLCNSTSCIECYDPQNMELDDDGTCRCKSDKKRLANSTDKCIDRGDHAIELTLSWIFLVSAIAFSL